MCSQSLAEQGDPKAERAQSEFTSDPIARSYATSYPTPCLKIGSALHLSAFLFLFYSHEKNFIPFNSRIAFVLF